jgi:hypothetical protein
MNPQLYHRTPTRSSGINAFAWHPQRDDSEYNIIFHFISPISQTHNVIATLANKEESNEEKNEEEEEEEDYETHDFIETLADEEESDEGEIDEEEEEEEEDEEEEEEDYESAYSDDKSRDMQTVDSQSEITSVEESVSEYEFNGECFILNLLLRMNINLIVKTHLFQVTTTMKVSMWYPKSC